MFERIFITTKNLKVCKRDTANPDPSHAKLLQLFSLMGAYNFFSYFHPVLLNIH